MLTNDIGSYFIVIQTRSKQMLHIVGFFKGGFCCLQDIPFFEKLEPNFVEYFYIFRVDYIGPPGLSCLADVKSLRKEPVLEEKIPFFSQRFKVTNCNSQRSSKSTS